MKDGAAFNPTYDFLTRAVAYLKSTVEADGEAALALPESDSPVLRPVGCGLMAAYVVDEPEGLVYVQHRHLAEGGMDAAQLHRSAIANLDQLCSQQMRVEQHGPIFGVFVDGNFEASMFLLQALWQRDLADLVDEGFMVAVPARDILAFCDMASEEGVATLKEMVERVQQNGDHLISGNTFRIRKPA
ncbi:Protein of unknown function [Duganella sp. CF458]|uniref:DUF1444 family protein n=1 Tax=Duganella sp. CF458 TaxID=1884368 RepID=UPI0008E340AB|nr:DUF1444 family protein [Duganella sp. CF458]SFF52256.1 Protein of unknown function [Duganella sp. CF458]